MIYSILVTYNLIYKVITIINLHLFYCTKNGLNKK